MRIFFFFFSMLLILPCNSCVSTFPANISFIFGCAVQFSHSVVSDSLQPHRLQYARLPCPSPTPGTYSNSFPLCWWWHPTISSSVVPPPPAFNLSQHQGLFQWVLCIRWPKYWSFSFSISPPVTIKDWFPLGLTGWIFLQTKGLSKVFSNTTVQKH